MKAYAGLLAILLAWPAPGLCGRIWTNDQGKEIEAEYVSSDGTTVVLKMKGREFKILLKSLSEQDRDYVDSILNPPPPPTGWRKLVPITATLYPETKEYFKDKVRRSSLAAFESGVAWPDSNRGPSEGWLKRDFEKDTCQIYVPASYDGKTAYGLYLHITPVPNGNLLPEWTEAFDELKLIAVSAQNVGNGLPMWRRVRLSVDALALVKEEYKIDSARIAVGGLSGGGHMAMLTAALFPELFVGAVSHAAQSYLPSGGNFGHFPGMTIRDFKRGKRKEMKWLVVSGNKDQNYGKILRSSESWKREKLDYRFLDIPGMGHHPAKKDDLLTALQWIGL